MGHETGYIGDYDIERFYRNAKIVEIYKGTEEIEKLTIARELPGENWYFEFLKRRMGL